MIAALLYLQAQSFRNRLSHRITRLKQPKYLVGAIVGGLYFYFYFFRYLFFPRSGRTQWLSANPDLLSVWESLGAFAVLVVVLGAWFFPYERAALTFSEAEVAFLFPAPISRRSLIHFKLLRSQLRIFLSVLFLTLITHRFGGNPWTHAAGWWLILSILNLHFLGSSFARTMLLDRGISNNRRRFVIGGAALALGLWLFWWAKNTMPELTSTALASLSGASEYLSRLFSAGPAPCLLYPFRIVVRPFLAPDLASFLPALGPALALFALHYIWVIYSNVAFEEASVIASQKLAEKVAAIRSGNWQAARKPTKGKRPWFNLKPIGPPAVALLWKNLIGAGQIFTWRLGLMLIILCVSAYIGFSGSAQRTNLFTLTGILIAMVLAWSLMLGPQVLRLDFRLDLPMADVLKTFPIPSWQIAAGEILAPVLILSCCQWLLLLLEGLVLLNLGGDTRPLFLSLVMGAAMLLPFINALVLLIPNAAVLLFPSWIQTGREGPRGIEATGQRLVFFLGQMLVLLLALIPAAAAFAAVFFVLRIVSGLPVAIPCAAFAGTVILAIESALGVLLLGKLFSRFDLSAENVP